MPNIDRQAEAQYTEWPMIRHDLKLTGRSWGKGRIKIPAIAGEIRYTAGDAVKLWAEDINGDGEVEYIFRDGGRMNLKD